MFCPKCHRRLHSATLFCPYDGTPLVREFEDDVDEEAGTTVYTGRDDSSKARNGVDRKAETVRILRAARSPTAPVGPAALDSSRRTVLASFVLAE